jgi:type II secretory pathway pseudopilin PulG
MAAVLVTVAVMAIVMTAALPVWRQQAQREKEAELLFRLSQYARAIELFRAKNGGAWPPSVDVLVDGKYLRKKYKDPITGEDFQPLYVGQQQQGAPEGRGGQRGRAGGPPAFGQPSGTPAFGQGQTGNPGGGIMGFVSKSKETSIRNHRGATTYNQWQVTSADAPTGPGAIPLGRGGQPGMGGPQATQPGGRGAPGRGVGPGGRGNTGGAGRGTVPGGRGGF